VVARQRRTSLSQASGARSPLHAGCVENTDVNFNTYVILPSIEACRGSKCKRNLPAEFGRATTQINASTKREPTNSTDAVRIFADGTSSTRNSTPLPASARRCVQVESVWFHLGGPVTLPSCIRHRPAFLHVELRGIPERRLSARSIACFDEDARGGLLGNSFIDEYKDLRPCHNGVRIRVTGCFPAGPIFPQFDHE